MYKRQDTPYDLAKLRAMDADVRLKATRINAPSLPIDDMQAHLKLKAGVLRLDPVSYTHLDVYKRQILFRLTEEGLGTWVALVVSALFFGFMHAGNPGATAWSSVAISIEAGLLFGLLYHVTRSLWWCICLLYTSRCV